MNKSELHNYPDLCIRTLAKKDIDQNIHMILGMVGEFFSEVLPVLLFTKDKKKQIEEFGDFFWYVGCFCKINDIEFKQSLKEPEHNLARLLGIIAETYKKHYAYGKDVGDFNKLIQDIIYKAFQLCEEYNLNIEEILQKNIEKLKIRYPEKFETEKALHKDESAEQKVFNENK